MHREFQVGDIVFLKVKGIKISLRPSNCKQLVTRFYGPFEFKSKIGPVAYELDLTPMVKVHNVFHVSLLKKYIYDSNHILDWYLVQVEPKRGNPSTSSLHIRQKSQDTWEHGHRIGKSPMDPL